MKRSTHLGILLLLLFFSGAAPAFAQFSMFLVMVAVMVAAFYLAFAAYFGAATAWRLETTVVMALVVIGLLGTRLPFALSIIFSIALGDQLHFLRVRHDHFVSQFR